MSITYLWLLAGVALALAEVLGISGVGLLFAGLGAIATGAVLYAGAVAETAYVSQWLICFVATAVCALLLWKPMQKFRPGKASSHYSNIVGETAYVGSSGLTRHGVGEVTWSGTIMKARLAKSAHVETIEAGAPVTIVEVQGATLIVKPKE